MIVCKSQQKLIENDSKGFVILLMKSEVCQSETDGDQVLLN